MRRRVRAISMVSEFALTVFSLQVVDQEFSIRTVFSEVAILRLDGHAEIGQVNDALLAEDVPAIDIMVVYAVPREG